MVLRSSGYQSPHIHAHGVVSGVYYVQIPDIVATAGDSQAGCLRFGQSIIQGEDERSQGSFLQMTVRPEEGMMVLFPSYVWHHTIPFESDTDRISIAFDVLPT